MDRRVIEWAYFSRIDGKFQRQMSLVGIQSPD